MARCSKCGSFTNNEQELPFFVVHCSDCKRQDAFLTEQRRTMRRAVLETTPEGRVQLAKERVKGCIGQVFGLIFLMIVIAIVASQDGKKSSKNSEGQSAKYSSVPDFDRSPQIPQSSSNNQQLRFIVAGISAGDFLNVREQPNPRAKIVGKISSGVIVTSSGRKEIKGSDTWIYIATAGCSGWVNFRFLKTI